jgi:hypothetical protein
MRFIKQYYGVWGGILLGFLLYGLKSFAEIMFHPLQGVFALFGLSLIFFTPFFYKFKVIIPLHGLVRAVFYFYLIWSFVIILRPLFEGVSYSLDSIHPYLEFGLTSYLLPFVVILGIEIISLPKLFKIIYIFAIIGFIYFVLNFKNMMNITSSGVLITTEDSDNIGINDLAYLYESWFCPSALSILCYEFISKKQKWVVFSSMAMLLFSMLYFARRGGVVIYSGYFIATNYLFLLRSNGANRFSKALFSLLIIGTVSLAVFMYSDTTFSLLFMRGNENTRSGVDESITRYLDSENAWFFGKGIEGAYPDSNFDKPRYTHETGYLYMILKGGVVYLSLYVFLLLHSAYLGFFKTKNRLTKAFAIYLLFHVLMLIPYGVISFGLEYLFVWVAFAICESYKYRLMTNQQIKYYLAITQ